MSSISRYIQPWLTRAVIVLLVVAPAVLAIDIGARISDADLRKALYTGATALIFGGLFGGVLKLVLDDLASERGRRENAAQFVINVLADLKAVYDRVAHARVVIPAHRSVETYGNEMRDLIQARVQLENVVRALRHRADGVLESVIEPVVSRVRAMGEYLDHLTVEFKDHYKHLSDLQRAYESKSKVILEHYAAGTENDSPPSLPTFSWAALKELTVLTAFIGPTDFRYGFEQPLDETTKLLREELAQILRRKRAIVRSAT